MTCELCGGPITDAQTSRKRFCSVGCRRRAEFAVRRGRTAEMRTAYAAQWVGVPGVQQDSGPTRAVPLEEEKQA